MKWFNKWFANKCKQAWEDEHVNHIGKSMAIETSPRNKIDSNGMNFNLYRADGGYVIETRVYDRRKDTSNTKLFIVKDDQNLGEEIGKIITFEQLRS